MTEAGPKFLDLFSREDADAVIAEAERLVLPGGRLLFRQGDPSDALYVILTGSLGVYVDRGNEDEELLALLGPGETVGEMGVVAATPRSATVRSIRDTELLRFTRSRFDALMKENPEAMHGISRILVHRLRLATRGGATSIEPKTIALLPASDGPDVAPVAERLAAALRMNGRRTVVVGSREANRDNRWFGRLEASNDVVLMCGNSDSVWIRTCARQADRIMVVADAGAEAISRLPDDLLRHRAAHQLLDLVVVSGAGEIRDDNVRRWLAAIDVNRHFHLRPDVKEDWARIARVIAGQGVGLVLSGGGARAYAQIGVVRAMREHGVPVDFAGGTSMGAVIAACVAMDWPIDEIEKRVRRCFVRRNPLSDYTLPLTSLVSGRRVESLLRENFGDADIVGLKKPFFCVSSNLTTGTPHIHRKGGLAAALRASLALPGILPPVLAADGVLVDGAVMNNLPVDVMRALHRGPIAAVNVARDLALLPDSLSRSETSMWSRLFRPPIVGILIRAATVSADTQDRRQADMADLVIEPPLGGIEIRDWKAFDRAVEIGYRHANDVLESQSSSLRRRRRMPLV